MCCYKPDLLGTELMDALKNLEASVQSLIQTIVTLRKERDDALRDAENVRHELHEACETIDRMKANSDDLDEPRERIASIERGKAEIVERLHDMLSQLDGIIDIEINTNEKE